MDSVREEGEDADRRGGDGSTDFKGDGGHLRHNRSGFWSGSTACGNRRRNFAAPREAEVEADRRGLEKHGEEANGNLFGSRGDPSPSP